MDQRWAQAEADLIARGTRCCFLEPSGRMRRSLRRYVSSGDVTRRCQGPMGYHDASTVLDVIEGEEASRDWRPGDSIPGDHPLWPKGCSCGYEFTAADPLQVYTERFYRRADTGQEITLRDAPPGAMWWADWNTWDVGPDGRCLMVRCPDGHDWTVDAEASNCTRKGDRSHKCWCRHGEPPLVTVDKNGDTCGAGAGSILTPKWHGFLRGGVLVPC